VLDVPEPEVELYRSRVLPVVRKLVAARVPEHVRVDGEGEGGGLAGTAVETEDGDELALCAIECVTHVRILSCS
jgi:hypothetical protein